jgi:hypothetical protein
VHLEASTTTCSPKISDFLDKYCIHNGLPKLQKWTKNGLGPLGLKNEQFFI